ncbi:MAG: DUF484 family protein [Rhodobacteraceae bacterium]|nr:MAG: DUF484 family protein [Paracoccaceae bacterium]
MTAAPEARTPGDETAALKARIAAEPALILDDRELMQALIAAGAPQGRNVVDLRGALVGRLESRLDQLSRTHRSVIAAAYENLAGVSQVHRATLALLDAESFEAVLAALLDETPAIIAVDAARLCIEVDDDGSDPAAGLPSALAERVVALPEGGVAAYVALGDAPEREGVWLRPTPPEAELLYGDEAGRLGSEALIALDLGDGRVGVVAFAAEDARRFSPDHGVDLVVFLGGVISRVLRRRLP